MILFDLQYIDLQKDFLYVYSVVNLWMRFIPNPYKLEFKRIEPPKSVTNFSVMD